MKFMRIGEPGRERPVVRVDDETFVEVWDVVGDFDGGFFASDHLERLQRAVAVRIARGLTHRFSGERIGAPIARPGQVVRFSPGSGTHLDGRHIPDVSIRSSPAVTGANDERSVAADARGGASLGVVLSRSVSRIGSDDEARDAILGFALVGDFVDESATWSSTTPIGPWLVTADEFAGVRDLGLWLDINGVRLRSTSPGAEGLDPYSAIRAVSQQLALEAGDVITLSPVHEPSERPFDAGDEVWVGIDALGAQSRRVVAPSRQLVSV